MTTISPAPVRRTFTVNADPDRAFAVFVAMGRWWQPSHSIAPSGQADVTIEPRAGGRWYETGKDGEICQWGEVLVYEPPHRLVMIWGLSTQWSYDPALRTEIEVTFTAEGTPEGTGTRVSFEHRNLDAYGDQMHEMSAQLGSDGGWTGLLGGFAAQFEA